MPNKNNNKEKEPFSFVNLKWSKETDGRPDPNLETIIEPTQNGHKYELNKYTKSKDISKDHLKVETICSGFCVYMLFEREISDILSYPFGERKYPSQEELFNNYFNPFLEKAKDKIPLFESLNREKFIKEFSKKELENLETLLDTLYSESNKSTPIINPKTIKTWTHNYVNWLKKQDSKAPVRETLFSDNPKFCQLFDSNDKRIFFTNLMLTKWGIINEQGDYILSVKSKYQVFALVNAGCEITFFTYNYHNPVYKIIAETIGFKASHMKTNQNDYPRFKEVCKVALREYKG